MLLTVSGGILGCGKGFVSEFAKLTTPPSTSAPPPTPDDTSSQTAQALSVTSFESVKSVLTSGEKLAVKLTLRYAGSTALSDDKQVFIHFVSASRPEWFEFSLYPLAGPKSSTWQGEVPFAGEVNIPTSASGVYSIQVGVNDGSSVTESANIQLGYGAGITETFGAGKIGYRYKVGSITVVAPISEPLPSTLRLLPIGDSMTAGHEDDPTRFRSYRGTLYALLKKSITSVDFVGPEYSVPAVGGDPHHAGYGGAQVGPSTEFHNIYDRLDGILSSAGNPDVMVLAFGWNSVYKEPALAASKYINLVNRIKTLRPTALLVVATLNPQKGQSEAQSNSLSGFKEFNDAARALANASPTDKVVLADLAALGGYTAEDYWDVIHLYQSGADKSATVIYKAIISALSPAAPKPGGVTNSVDQIVSDMRELNDFRLKGYENKKAGWYIQGENQFGVTTPNIYTAPTWHWLYNNLAFKDTVWDRMLPWTAVFAGVDNRSTNSAFQLRGIRAYIKLRSTGQWKLMSTAETMSGVYYPTPGRTGGGSEIRLADVDGYKTMKLSPNNNDYLWWHGWAGGFNIDPNDNDLAAVFVTAQARLVVADPKRPDDRAQSQYGLQIAADYKTDPPLSDVYPATAIGRIKLLTNEWKVFNTMTFTDVGNQNPGRSGLTESQFRAAPPPLN